LVSKVIGRLDVDGYLTNSQKLSQALARLAPTAIMHLAADLETMSPVRPIPKYMHNVTYLGSASSSKHNLREMLVAAAPFGLAIYGVKWDELATDARSEEWKQLLPYWKGVLPVEDIAALYSSSKVRRRRK
jgi:hypothetical protein